MTKKSPTLRRAQSSFNKINGQIDSLAPRWIACYSVTVFFLLVLVKPRFVVDIDYTKTVGDSEFSLSYTKLIAWTFIFHIPLAFYMLFELNPSQREIS